jgi:hypothetical protein
MSTLSYKNISHFFIYMERQTSQSTHLVDSKGYVINFGSKGISGSVLQYLTLHTSSDLEQSILVCKLKLTYPFYVTFGKVKLASSTFSLRVLLDACQNLGQFELWEALL